MVDLQKLIKLGQVKKYLAGEFFFREGDPAQEMYLILKGRVEIMANSPENSGLPSFQLGQQDFFGESFLLEKGPRRISAKALEDTLVLAIGQHNFSGFVSTHPELAKRLEGKKRRTSLPQAAQNCRHDSPQQTPMPQVEKTAVSGEAKAILFPPGHKIYQVKAPATHETYIYDKTISCPVCGRNFTTKMIRRSRLRLLKTEADLRSRFVDFDSLWYNISVCPHCYYANFTSEFQSLSQAEKKMIQEKCREIRGDISFHYSTPREIDQVFTAYYLALYCVQAASMSPAKAANIWLFLSWLYQDVQDAEMYTFASHQALQSMKQAYYSSTGDASTEQEQRLNYLLGELFLRNNEQKEAAKHFLNSIVRVGGSRQINELAQDRIQQLKAQAVKDRQA